MRGMVAANLFAIFWAAWRRRYLIGVPILAMPVIGLLVSEGLPKKYESYTTILIQEAAKQNPFLEDLTVATNLKERMEALRALLHSRHILAEVAARMGMISEEMTEKDRAEVIASLSSSLKVKLVGEDLVQIAYTADSTEKMEDLLKLVSLRFVERIIAPQRSSISQSEKFLSEELEKRRGDLTEAEARLAKYKSENADELPELHSSNVGRLGNLSERLAERRTAFEGAKAAKATLHTRLAETNPVVGYIEDRIVAVMGELAELRARYTDRHTRVQAALRRLSSLEDERSKALASTRDLTPEDLERLWNMASSATLGDDNRAQPLLVSQLERFQEATSRVNGLEEEVAALTAEVSALSQRVAAYGEHERRLTELRRDIEIKRKIYEDLAERHQLARVTGALGRAEENERVKLIDPPFTPISPTNPPLLVFLIAGIIGGVALGIGLATAAEITDTTLYRRDALEKLIGAPVLTRIPVLTSRTLATGDHYDET